MNPIPDDQLPSLIASLVAGIVWVIAVPAAARWLLKRPPLVVSLPACIGAATALVYLDLPVWVPFVATWFALPVVVTVALALLSLAVRRRRG